MSRWEDDIDIESNIEKMKMELDSLDFHYFRDRESHDCPLVEYYKAEEVWDIVEKYLGRPFIEEWLDDAKKVESWREEWGD